MVERSGGEVDLLAEAQAELAEQRVDDGRIGRGAERTLRLPGGAGRVDHGPAGTLVGRVGRLGVRLSVHHVGPGVEAGRSLTTERHERPHLRETVRHLGDQWCLLGVDDDDRGVGVVDHVRHLVRVEPIRERHRDETTLARGMDRRP